jgi:hypothetical protein
VDTDSSSADFLAVTPTPRTSASTALACGAGSTQAPSSVQGATVDLDLQPVLAISLERSALSFGHAAAGDTPPLLSERVTVTSNNALGYALTVHRSTFQPSDLPLIVTAAAATPGGQLSAALAGGALVPVPASPAADLLLGTTTAAATPGGDVWPLSFGFSALPAAPPGHYTASLTFTVIGR